MKILILSCFPLALALAGGPVWAQEDGSEVPDVESLMTTEDFQASGLDKLSDAERAHLSEWVKRYREGAFTGPQVSRPPSKQTEEEREADKNFEMVAKVVPKFWGWSGKTVFKLDNGQTWQQRMPGRFRYGGSDSEVTVTKNLLGGYVLEHLDSGRAVPVKRVD
jgi:hypothetical protein